MSILICWLVVLLIVIIVVVGIILRIWAAQPLKKVRNIVTTHDILRNFTSNVSICLLKLLDTVHTGTYKLFHMEEMNIITVKGRVKLNDTLVKELSKKRVVIVAKGDDSRYAIKLANKLSNMYLSVSLVTYEYSPTNLDKRVHAIKTDEC